MLYASRAGFFRLLAAFVLLAATTTCGGADERPSRPVAGIGKIDTTADPARRNGQPVAHGADLHRKDELSTMDEHEIGEIRFHLNEKFERCRLRGSLILFPSRDVWLAYEDGETTCVTDNTDPREVKLRAKSATLTVNDPIFSVNVRKGDFTVQVYRGFVRARSGEGEAARSLLIGPEEQSVVPHGQPPGQLARFDPGQLSPQDRNLLAEMEKLLSPPALGFPARLDPALVSAIEQSGIINVVIGQGASEGTVAFVRGFVSFLAKQWGLREQVSVQALVPGGAPQSPLDIVVSPSTGETDGRLPFLGDEQDRLWFLELRNAGPGLKEAFENFLVSSLNTGDYGRLYFDSYGEVANYEPLGHLLFKDIEPPPVPPPPAPTPLPTATPLPTDDPPPEPRGDGPGPTTGGDRPVFPTPPPPVEPGGSLLDLGGTTDSVLDLVRSLLVRRR